VDIVDRPEHALPTVCLGVIVADFDGFVLPDGGAGGDDGGECSCERNMELGEIDNGIGPG
jgi:hypothetical protein